MDRVQILTIKPEGIGNDCHCKIMFLYRKLGATETAHFPGFLQRFFFFKKVSYRTTDKNLKKTHAVITPAVVGVFVWGGNALVFA